VLNFNYNFTFNLILNSSAVSEHKAAADEHESSALSPANLTSASKPSNDNQTKAGEEEKQLWLRYWRVIFGRREIRKVMVLVNPFSGTKKAKTLYDDIVKKVRLQTCVCWVLV
jgi:hypothetical protein